jgi:hypothetical protein
LENIAKLFKTTSSSVLRVLLFIFIFIRILKASICALMVILSVNDRITNCVNFSDTYSYEQTENIIKDGWLKVIPSILNGEDSLISIMTLTLYQLLMVFIGLIIKLLYYL